MQSLAGRSRVGNMNGLVLGSPRAMLHPQPEPLQMPPLPLILWQGSSAHLHSKKDSSWNMK